MTKLWHFAIALSLVACEPSELRPVPVPIGGGSGGSYSAPKPAQKPLAPPKFQSKSENVNIPGKQEVHAAATESDCHARAKMIV